MPRGKRIKKKTVARILVAALFVAGIIIGFFIPRDFFSNAVPGVATPKIVEVGKNFGKMDAGGEGYKYSVVDNSPLGTITLYQVDGQLAQTSEGFQNIFVYRGKVLFTAGTGNSLTINQGTIIGVGPSQNYTLQSSEGPAELIVFS